MLARAFLTGATGTVGREVCAALLTRGAEVRVGARASSPVASILPDADDVVLLDFEDPTISPSLFEGIDAFLEEQARDMMLQMGTPPWLVEAGLAVFAHAKAGGEAAVDPALTQILERPATSLSEFVERNSEEWA